MPINPKALGFAAVSCELPLNATKRMELRGFWRHYLPSMGAVIATTNAHDRANSWLAVHT